MELKIIKIDGEFVIIELKNGERKVCPTAILPEGTKENSMIEIYIKEL